MRPVNDIAYIARSPTPREADVSSSIHYNLCHHVMPTRDQFLNEAWDDDDDDTPPPLMNISQQHHSMMTPGLKNQFWKDTCTSTGEMMIQITSVPILVCMTASPSAWTYRNVHQKVKQCLTMNR